MTADAPRIRVAHLDDQAAVRAGIEAILAAEPDLEIVGSAASENELWALLEHTHPAVVILDLHHPGRDGLELCLQVKLRPDPPAVVLYSAHLPGAQVVAAAVAGADSIISKSTAPPILVEAIRNVAGESRTGPPITLQMKAEAAARLDPADHAILAMRVAGDAPVEIAATLGVPDATIPRRMAAIVSALQPV
jgi:DNA-binding NarL/FixJ family response regulator